MTQPRRKKLARTLMPQRDGRLSWPGHHKYR